MEIIKLNDKEYINKADVESEYIKRSSIEEEYVLKNSKVEYKDSSVQLLTECRVMGIGSVKLSGDWKTVKIGLSYLNKAIKCLELMTCHKKRESIVLAVAKDYPLCLGDIEGDKFSGIIIAPVVNRD